MGALGAFDPSFLSRGPQINYGPSATDLYGKYLSLQGMMEQQKIRQIQLQQEQMQLEQKRQAQADSERLRTFLQANPDLSKPEVQQALYGYGVPGIAVAQKYAEAAKERQQTESARLEAQIRQNTLKEAALGRYTSGIYGLKNVTDPGERLNQYLAISMDANKDGVIDANELANRRTLTEAPNGESLTQDLFRHGGAQKYYELQGKDLTTQKEQAEALATKKAQAVTDLRQAPVDPATGLPTKEFWAGWRQAYPEMRDAPPAPTKDYIDRVVTAGIAPKDLPGYEKDVAAAAAYQALVKKPREQWMAEAAQAVPAELHVGNKTFDTSGLQERTMGEVKSRLDMGDYKGAQAAIEKGQQNIADTEKTYRGAAVTAPIKIEVAAGQAAARSPSMTDEGLDLMAERIINKENPGTRNVALIARATNRAAELLKERGMTAQAAIMAQHAAEANKKGLDVLTKQYEVLKPFGETAEKSAALLEQRLGEVTDLGSSLLNTPIRDLEAKFGSTKVAALRAALLPVRADFARLLNSAAGTAAVHVESQNEMRQAIQDGATVGQMKAALDVFRQDWKIRKQETEAQIQDLTRRSVVGGAGAGGQARPAPPVGTVKDGWRFKGGDPAAKENWEQVSR